MISGRSSVVEHHVTNVIVEGSTPFTRSNLLLLHICGRSSVVEHHVANVIVEGSTPFARSIYFKSPSKISKNIFFMLQKCKTCAILPEFIFLEYDPCFAGRPERRMIAVNDRSRSRRKNW